MCVLCGWAVLKVTARARLWQMEYQRQLSYGRLAEILGDSDGAIESDQLMRMLGLRPAATRAYAVLPAETKSILEAYAAGVNAYLASRPRLPIEFLLLGHRPAPWQPIDCIMLSKLTSLDLSGNLHAELERFRLLVNAQLPWSRVSGWCRNRTVSVRGVYRCT